MINIRHWFMTCNLDCQWVWRNSNNWWHGILWRWLGPKQSELMKKAKARDGAWRYSLKDLIREYI